MFGYTTIGVTGTRHGAPIEQYRTLVSILSVFACLDANKLRHGDCKGFDEQAFGIAAGLDMYTIAHPPVNKSWRAFTNSSIVVEPQPYAERNAVIVADSHLLVAGPRTVKEEKSGGTWQTVRMARNEGIPIIIIEPSGVVRTERTRDL